MRSVFALLSAALLVASVIPTGASAAGRETVMFTAPLPNVPGHGITAVIVSYGPGEGSPVHQHAGSVYAYVLAGAIRSENSATGPARVYRAGESFFEPPGSTHRISGNASRTKPARLLAIFVAADGATLTFTPK